MLVGCFVVVWAWPLLLCYWPYRPLTLFFLRPTCVDPTLELVSLFELRRSKLDALGLVGLVLVWSKLYQLPHRCCWAWPFLPRSGHDPYCFIPAECTRLSHECVSPTERLSVCPSDFSPGSSVSGLIKSSFAEPSFGFGDFGKTLLCLGGFIVHFPIYPMLLCCATLLVLIAIFWNTFVIIRCFFELIGVSDCGCSEKSGLVPVFFPLPLFRLLFVSVGCSAA